MHHHLRTAHRGSARSPAPPRNTSHAASPPLGRSILAGVVAIESAHMPLVGLDRPSWFPLQGLLNLARHAMHASSNLGISLGGCSTAFIYLPLAEHRCLPGHCSLIYTILKNTGLACSIQHFSPRSDSRRSTPFSVLSTHGDVMNVIPSCCRDHGALRSCPCEQLKRIRRCIVLGTPCKIGALSASYPNLVS